MARMVAEYRYVASYDEDEVHTWDSLASLCADYWGVYEALGGDHDGEDLKQFQREYTAGEGAASNFVMDLPIGPDPRIKAVLVALAESAPTRQSLFFLGAGPLQDLVNDHGDDVIQWLIDTAERVPRFRIALSGVWVSEPTRLSPSTLQRLTSRLGEDDAMPF